MRDMLPTRSEWQAANPGKAAPASGPEPPSATRVAPPPRRRRPNWRAAGGFRKQAIVSVAVIAAFAVVVITATKPSPAHPRRAAAPAASTAAPAASTAAPAASRAAPAASTAAPSLAGCVAAWNGGKSAEHRHDLARTVAPAGKPTAPAGEPAAPAGKPAAVIATYTGPDREVARVGGGNPVLVRAGACVVAADGLVFLRQPDGSWGQTKATSGPFTSIARDPTWMADHANAVVQLGSPALAGALAVDPKRTSLVFLAPSDVGTG